MTFFSSGSLRLVMTISPHAAAAYGRPAISCCSSTSLVRFRHAWEGLEGGRNSLACSRSKPGEFPIQALINFDWPSVETCQGVRHQSAAGPLGQVIELSTLPGAGSCSLGCLCLTIAARRPWQAEVRAQRRSIVILAEQATPLQLG